MAASRLAILAPRLILCGKFGLVEVVFEEVEEVGEFDLGDNPDVLAGVNGKQTDALGLDVFEFGEALPLVSDILNLCC